MGGTTEILLGIPAYHINNPKRLAWHVKGIFEILWDSGELHAGWLPAWWRDCAHRIESDLCASSAKWATEGSPAHDPSVYAHTGTQASPPASPTANSIACNTDAPPPKPTVNCVSMNSHPLRLPSPTPRLTYADAAT